MIVRKLRLERGWSQEQLAQMSGLNIRTIQRIERGQNAGLESLKSLAAVFEIDLSQLQPEPPMETAIPSNPVPTYDNSYAKRKLLTLAFRFILISALLFAINLTTNPHQLWAVIPTLVFTFIVLWRTSLLFLPPTPKMIARAACEAAEPVDPVYRRTRFLMKLVRYLVVTAMLFAINLLTNPGYIWAWWPAIGMGFALAFTAVDALVIEPLKVQDKPKP